MNESIVDYGMPQRESTVLSEAVNELGVLQAGVVVKGSNGPVKNGSEKIIRNCKYVIQNGS